MKNSIKIFIAFGTKECLTKMEDMRTQLEALADTQVVNYYQNKEHGMGQIVVEQPWSGGDANEISGDHPVAVIVDSFDSETILWLDHEVGEMGRANLMAADVHAN